MRTLQSLLQLRAALQTAARQAGRGGSAVEASWLCLQRATMIAALRSSAWSQVWHDSSQVACRGQRRLLSGDVQASSSAEPLDEEHFHKVVDRTLDDLLERLEQFVEDLDDVDGDVEYSQGVLTVRLGELGTYVINKQTPNRQIWMSSPLSGPVRYDWGPGIWTYHRDGHQLHARLSSELKQLTGHELDLSPCFACGKLNTCAGEQCGQSGTS